MAEENETNEENEENEEASPEGKSSKKKKMIIIIVAAVLVLVGVSVGVMMMMGGDSDEEGDASADEEVVEEVKKEALYFSIDPAFVVNFQGDGGRSHHLQITLKALTYDEEVYAAVRKHMPLIRNNLVLLFSSQKKDELSTLEGKEKLRAEVLKELKTIVEGELGRPGVDDVFFTGFVMQ